MLYTRGETDIVDSYSRIRGVYKMIITGVMILMKACIIKWLWDTGTLYGEAVSCIRCLGVFIFN